MSTPLSNTRRIEALERRLAEQNQLVRALLGRPARAQGKRWTFWAKTVPDESQEDPYPTAGANFPFKFFDREFTAVAGGVTKTDTMRSAEPLAIGRTVNGQFLIPDSIVLAQFMPPPPNTTGKGCWHLVPIQTHYMARLNDPLGGGATTIPGTPSASTASILRLVGGQWTDTGYDVTVKSFFTSALNDNTRVRIDWEETDWVVNVAGCGADP